MDNATFQAYIAEAELNRADRNRDYGLQNQLHERLVNEALVTKYPIQCGNVRLGISIGAGWIPSVEEMCDKIQILMNMHAGFTVMFMQIKEKLGGLRAYCRVFSLDEEGNAQFDPTYGTPTLKEEHKWLSDEVFKIISAAEDECDKRCEVCGEPGTSGQSRRGYVHTACEKHRVQ
jgi:hypothetical protein